MKKIILTQFVLLSSILPALSQPNTAADFIKAAQTWRTESVTSAGNWENMGIDDNVRVGRVNCMAFHPDNADIIYAGTPSGGLWKTENHGNSWHPLTDDLPTLGVSAIVVIPKPGGDILYIGTGDRDGGDSYGVGVLKSTDGGITWKTTGLSFETSDSVQVTGLKKHPINDDILFATISYRYNTSILDGVYITTDGGQTWSKVNNVTLDLNSRFIDIELDPLNPDHIYLSTWSNTANDTYIFRSQDMGITWSIIFTTKGSRTEMAVSTDPNKPNWMYAVVADIATSKGWGLKGVYKFLNGGANYLQLVDGQNLNLLGETKDGTDIGVGQGIYDLCIAVDPNNGNRLFVGGINTFVTEDGYHWLWDNFHHISVLQTLQKYHSHADKHFLIFRPGTSQLYECNDGGIFERKNKRSWIGMSKGMVISQVYRLGLHPDKKNKMLAGLQDNGTQNYNGRGWNRIHHSDGMECVFDYEHPRTQYASSQDGDLVRTDLDWAGAVPISITRKLNGDPKPPLTETGGWVTPYVLDPDDSKTLFLGLENVWVSNNKGNHWDKISSFGGVSGLKIVSLAVAKNGDLNRYIYASKGKQLWWIDYGGGDWSQAPDLPRHISYISVSNSLPTKAWVSLDGYHPDGVYEFDAAANTITSISQGLPNVPVYCVVQNKNNFFDEELYAATRSGIYRKIGPLEWEPFIGGLPNVTVQELEFFYPGLATPTLYAATFGRGMWRTELEYYDYRLWTGLVSVDWNDPENWYPKIIPGSGTNVYIPAGCPYWPLIDNLTLGTDCKNVRMYNTSELHITLDLEIAAGYKMTCDSLTKLYVGGGWRNENNALHIRNGFGFLPEPTSEVIFEFQHHAPVFAVKGAEIFQNLTINKVVPGPGRFRPSSDIIVNQLCHLVSGTWDDTRNLNHNLYGDFLIENPGVFHMQPGGILEFSGSEPQVLNTLSSDSYNNFRNLKINGIEVLQESDMAGPNKINEKLSVVNGIYSVGKLQTEVLGLVSIATNTVLQLDKTTLLINDLSVANNGVFRSGGISGDSSRVGKVTGINFRFMVDGIIESSFTRFHGMNADGIYITGIGNIIGGFNNCTFSTDEPVASLLKINNDKTQDIYYVKFNFLTTQKTVSKTINAGDVSIYNYEPSNSQDYENDLYNLVDWNMTSKTITSTKPAINESLNEGSSRLSSNGNTIKQASKPKFNIYPNPASGSFIITTSASGQNQMINILDMTGQVIRKINMYGERNKNVTGMAPGTYIIQLINSEGTQTKKLVVQ